MQRVSTYVATAVLAALIGTGPASAQSGADYFNGRTVDFVVATNAGGGYDTNGRLVAEFMQRHLPGSTFVVRNMPGAGHMVGANYIYAAEPNGLTIGTFNTGLIYNQLIENPGVNFDLGEMSWVGKVASEPRVIIISTLTDIETWEDLINVPEPIRFGVAGVGSAAYTESTMLTNALDLPIQIISGYDGTEDSLAMMRGEVQGSLGSRSSFMPFVNDGNGRMIVQIGGDDEDVPQLADLIEDEAGQRAVALVEAQAEIARLVAGPPGIPEDVLATLREAFEAAVTDPEFIARAEQLGLPVDPLVGDEVAEAINAALDQSPEMVDFLKQMLAN